MAELRTGARILVDQLVAQGVSHAFCVPGESYLAVLDALHDASIALTVCRQEGGAAMMARVFMKHLLCCEMPLRQPYSASRPPEAGWTKLDRTGGRAADAPSPEAHAGCQE